MSDLVFTAHPNAHAGVKGITSIHHKLRLKLNLSFEEYCLVDFFHGWNNKYPDKKVTFDDILKATGMYDRAILNTTISGLYDRKILHKAFNPMPCKDWQNWFDHDEAFEKLWETFDRKGNKAQALKVYRQVVKQVGAAVLQTAAEKYVAGPGINWTYRAHLSTWLNPDNKHWEDLGEKPNTQSGENRLSVKL